MSLERRIARLEQAEKLAQARRQRRMFAVTAAEFGLTVDDLMAEAEAFFALSLDEQLAKVDRHVAALGAEGLDVEQIKTTLIQYYQP
jgi:hypothetical protein